MVALRRGFGDIEPEQIKKAISENKEILSKKDENGELLITTKQALEEEKKLVRLVRNGKGKFVSISKDYEIKNEQLSDEQRKAVEHVLKSKDSIIAIEGKAGVGKTYSISEVRDAAKENGMKFFAVAPSSEASRTVQREEGFEGATTIAELLKNEQLHSAIKNGVLWVDEVSLVGNSTMIDVLELANKQNARVLITGDPYQHSSTERGDSFKILKKYGGVASVSINKIRRQKSQEYRDAVTMISKGNVVEGFDKLDSMGAIKESESVEEIYDKAANEYIEARVKKQKTLVVSTTHKQGESFTKVLREKLKLEDHIAKEERKFTIHERLNLTTAEKNDVMNYQEGQAIQFHQNAKRIKRGEKFIISKIDKDGNIFIKNGNEQKKLPFKHSDRFSIYEKKQITLAKNYVIRITQNGYTNDKKRLNNGNTLTVKRFRKDGNIIADTGRQEVLIYKEYANFNYGYYNTSHSSQGKTVNKVIILQSVFSGKAASKEQFYVSSSRGKYEISIHTDDKKHMLNSIQKSSSRMTATELAEGKDKQKEMKKRKQYQKRLAKNIKQITERNLITKSRGINYGK